jgi:organic hydroperoxide reductase OsmC/OhrA
MMIDRAHRYAVTVSWTGNRGSGTRDYRSYDRDHEIQVPGKPILGGSADPAFLGDSGRYNPEEMLVAALSACHMLWYLHLCAENGVVVTEYRDEARGLMVETSGGVGHFYEVELRPAVVIRASSSIDVAIELHERAHQLCYIARSVNFAVRCAPTVVAATRG